MARKFRRTKRVKFSGRKRRFAKRVAKITKKTINRMSETKWYASPSSSFDANSLNVQTWPFEQVTGGVDVNGHRIGSSIMVKRISLYLKLRIVGGSVTGQRHGVVRMIIAYPRKSIYTSPSTLDWIPSYSGDKLLGFLSPNEYVTLKDKHWILAHWEPTRYSGGSPTYHYYRWSKRVNIKLNYPLAGGLPAHREPFVVFTSDFGVSDDSKATIDVVFRISYKDI